MINLHKLEVAVTSLIILSLASVHRGSALSYAQERAVRRCWALIGQQQRSSGHIAIANSLVSSWHDCFGQYPIYRCCEAWRQSTRGGVSTISDHPNKVLLRESRSYFWNKNSRAYKTDFSTLRQMFKARERTVGSTGKGRKVTVSKQSQLFVVDKQRPVLTDARQAKRSSLLIGGQRHPALRRGQMATTSDPFKENVIRLPNLRCTGTLVSPLHVLTAASCVHDGEDFLPSLEGIKTLQIPSRFASAGREISHAIKAFKIPAAWELQRSNNSEKWLSEKVATKYGFAIVELAEPISDDRVYAKLAVPNQVQVNSYPSQVASRALVYSSSSADDEEVFEISCTVENLFRSTSSLVHLTPCDAGDPTNLGAAIQTNACIKGEEQNWKIVGVLAAPSDDQEVKDGALGLLKMTAAMMDEKSLLVICAMMASSDGYSPDGVCVDKLMAADVRALEESSFLVADIQL